MPIAAKKPTMMAAEKALADDISREAAERLPPRPRYYGNPDLKDKDKEEYEARLEVEDEYLPHVAVLAAPQEEEQVEECTADQQYVHQAAEIETKPDRPPTLRPREEIPRPVLKPVPARHHYYYIAASVPPAGPKLA